MSDIGAMVAELIEAGCPPEAAARVVAAAFVAGRASADCHVTSADESVTRRRENDRLRQQKRRDNLRMSRDERDNPRDVTPPSLSKEEKKEEIKEEREPARKARPRTRLPELWQLDEQDTGYATERGFHNERLRQMASAFANHHRANGTTMADWHAAWRKWVDNEIKYHGGRNGYASGSVHPNSSAQQSGSTAVIAGVAAAAERRARERSAAGQQRQTPVDADPAERDDPQLFRAIGS